MLNRLLSEAGIDRSTVYVDNVYPFRPPEPAPMGDRLKSVPTDELVYWMNDLHKRLGALSDPYVIVPTGNYALYALLRKGKVAARLYNAQGYDVSTTDAERKAGITQVRGSIYVYRDMRGRMIKVVPTIHPAGILQAMGWEWRTIRDWKRIARLARTRAWEPPMRNVLISPTVRDWQDAYSYLAAHPSTPIFTDVETWGGVLRCCGFSWRQDEAIVFPMPDKRERAFWLPYVRAICELPNPKGGQNFLYDAYWYAWHGIRLRNMWFDCMTMHHCLDPNEDHDLAFLASIYTEQPYWKDEAKEAEEIVKYVKDMDALYRYNGLDCCTPVEIASRLIEELSAAGMLDFYYTHYVRMYEPLLDTMLNGIRVDVARQKEIAKLILKECDEMRVKLKGIAGEELYAVERKSRMRAPTRDEWEALLTKDWWVDNENLYAEYLHKYFVNGNLPKAKYIDRDAAKRLGYIMSKGQIREYTEKPKEDFSRIKLLRFFHERMGVKEMKGRGKKRGKVLMDDTALRKIALNYATRIPAASEAAALILTHRAKKKEHDIVKGAWDSDGRIRCQYKLTTKQARLSSSKNPMRRGYNLQNVKRGEMRKTFLADEGCVMVRLDYSQIEDRICKMYTGDAQMIALANTKPWEYDAHTETAKYVFKTEQPTKLQRQISKSINHAAQRGMAGETMSNGILKQTRGATIIPPRECDRMLAAYHERFWQISKLYFPYVQQNLIRDGYLVNSWGFKSTYIRSPGIRFTQDLWDKAYSFYMQSDCAGWLNQLGFIPAWEWLRAKGKRPSAQVHDEVMAASVEPGWSWEYMTAIVRSMETARRIRGEKLVVPVGITVGVNWSEGVEWKRMPSRDEWEETVKRVMKEA